MTTSHIRPYLSRNDLYSLSWVCYPVVCILFVAFHLKLATNSVADGVEDAKRALAASCNAAQKAATVAVSLPRYLAQGTNDEINETIHETLLATESAFGLVLTGVQGIISFVIDTFRSLHLCIFQFIVRGALALMIEATNGTKKYLGTITGGIADGVQGSINVANQAASGAVSAVNTIINAANSFIDNIPQVCIPFAGCTPRPNKISTINPPTVGFDVSQIRNFNIPDTFQQQIIALNSSLPTLDQLRGRLDQLVAIPFNLVRSEMNTTFTEVSKQIGNVTLPVPPVRAVEFCSGMDMSFIDTLGHELVRIANICIGVLVACAALIVLWNCIIIWLQWKKLSQATQVVRTSWEHNNVTGEKGFHPNAQLTPASLMTLHVQMQHTFSWRIVNLFTRVFKLNPISRDRLAWFFAFIFHPSAMTCLLVGLFGILFICIQLIAIKPIQNRIKRETNELVSYVTNSIGGSINTALAGESQNYANAMNTVLGGIRTTLNDELFSWIDTASGALNSTIVAYYDEVQNGVKTAFGNSLFATAANQFLDCVLGNKIDAIQTAITFLKANLRITIPTIPSDVLLLSPALLSDVSQPVADAAIGGDDGGLFGSLLNRYLNALKGELIMFGVILGIWVLIVVIGLIIIAWDAWGKQRYAAWRVRKTASPSPVQNAMKERPEAAPLPEKSTVAEDMKANLPPLEKDRVRAEASSKAATTPDALHKGDPTGSVKEESRG